MPPTYTYDIALATDKDRVRFIIGDTGTTPDDNTTVEWLLANEEIAYLLTTSTNIYDVAARALDIIAFRFSRQADRQIGEFSESLSKRAEAYRAAAEELREQYGAGDAAVPAIVPYVGGLTYSDKRTDETNTDLVRPAIRRGMDDNGSSSTGRLSPIIIFPSEG